MRQQGPLSSLQEALKLRLESTTCREAAFFLNHAGCAQIRGVPVGSAVRVQPSLERVEVLCDIKDTATVIPRNSLIEANQSGLIAEPLIDITPQLPIPQYQVSHLRPACQLTAVLLRSASRLHLLCLAAASSWRLAPARAVQDIMHA